MSLIAKPSNEANQKEEKLRQFEVLYSICKNYFEKLLGDNPSLQQKIDASMDAKFGKGLSPSLVKVSMGSLTIPERQVCREIALNDVMTKIAVSKKKIKE
jgi:hypothetical protein